jgi:hypothetical protein
VSSGSQLRGLDELAREAISTALLRLGMAALWSEGLRQAEQIELVLIRIRRPPAAKPAELDVGGMTSEQDFPSNVIDINTRRRVSLAVTSTDGRR